MPKRTNWDDTTLIDPDDDDRDSFYIDEPGDEDDSDSWVMDTD